MNLAYEPNVLFTPQSAQINFYMAVVTKVSQIIVLSEQNFAYHISATLLV